MYTLKKQHILFSFLMTFLCSSLFAQDPHFSQYFASPLTLNPAYTGKFNGFEISISYIAKFKDPYKKKINCPKY